LPARSLGFIITLGESEGTLMAKRFRCRSCLVEIEAVALADGTAALVCIDCDVMGLAHEVEEGGPMWPAGLRFRAVRRLDRSLRAIAASARR
jgi:hypothetical protein